MFERSRVSSDSAPKFAPDIAVAGGPNGRTFKIENFAGIWHTGIPCVKISVAARLKARSNKQCQPKNSQHSYTKT